MSHDVDGVGRDIPVVGGPRAYCLIQPVGQVRHTGIKEAIGDVAKQGRPGNRTQLAIRCLLGRGTIVCGNVQGHRNPPIPQGDKEISSRRVANIVKGLDNIVVRLGQRFEGQLLRGQPKIQYPFINTGC